MPEFSAPIGGYVGFCFLGYALANTEFSLPWRLEHVVDRPGHDLPLRT